MNHQMLRNDCHDDGDTHCRAVNTLELVEQGTRGQQARKTDTVWTVMGSDKWSPITCGGVETIEDLLVQGDLAGELLPINTRKRLGTTTDRNPLSYDDNQITGLLSATEGVGSVDIAGLIQSIIDWRKKCQLAALGHVQGINFRTDFRSALPLLVQANAHWLRRAFDILCDNGSEAMVDLPTKKLTISAELKDNGANIQVSDTGKGIPAELQPLLFKEPIRKSPGNRGTALLLARRVVEAYGGKLQLQSTGANGTTMSVWLPLEWLREEGQTIN